MLGILSKSATLPFHTWLPDAGVAPSPVTALLHAAVLVKIGVYVYARLFVVTFDIAACGRTAVLVVAAASALVSAGAALMETDLKRLIAYSTVSQIAFIFFGFAVGGITGKAAEIGVTGALLYILMHGLAKGGLFLCAGIVEQRTHTKDIRQLGGLARTMPLTAVAFLLCAFSVMGIPPFGGFFANTWCSAAAAESGQLWIGLVFLAAAFMTILYLFRAFTMVFLGEPKSSQADRRLAGDGRLGGGPGGAVARRAGCSSTRAPQFAQAAALQMLGNDEMTDWIPILFCRSSCRWPARCWCWRCRKRVPYVREAVALLAALGNLVAGRLPLQRHRHLLLRVVPGLEFALRLYRFSAFILLAVAGFSFLVTLYCWRFMRDRNRPAQFYAYLLSRWRWPTAPCWPTTWWCCCSSGKGCSARCSA